MIFFFLTKIHVGKFKLSVSAIVKDNAMRKAQEKQSNVLLTNLFTISSHHKRFIITQPLQSAEYRNMELWKDL